MAAYSAFRRGLRRALSHGAWGKLDEKEKLKFIVECVKEEIFSLPTKRSWWEWLTGV